jgi:hypothetical protein
MKHFFLLSTEIELLEKYNLSIVNHHKLLNSNLTYGYKYYVQITFMSHYLFPFIFIDKVRLSL